MRIDSGGLSRIRSFAFGVILLVSTPAIAAATAFEGELRVGTEQFHVIVEFQERAAGYWLSLAIISETGSTSRFAAELGESSSFYVVDGTRHPLPKLLAKRWASELESQFLAFADTAGLARVEKSEDELVLESQKPVTLTEFLTGRVRLRYARQAPLVTEVRRTERWIEQRDLILRVIEVYCMSDWLNGFGDNVTLVLTRRGDIGR